MIIKKDNLVLFQGDSVTDCGRSYEDDSSLGTGYAMMISAWISDKYPELNIRFMNKGVSGNRTSDLKIRWQKDCIDLKPNVISILIGINDCWRRFDDNDPMSVEEFASNYRYLLEEIKNKLNAQIILCEPFLLPVTEEQKKLWREDLNPKIQVVRELAREFSAIYVQFDEVFAAASAKREPNFWAADGVHPTQAGHVLMAQSWIEAINASK